LCFEFGEQNEPSASRKAYNTIAAFAGLYASSGSPDIWCFRLQLAASWRMGRMVGYRWNSIEGCVNGLDREGGGRYVIAKSRDAAMTVF
jgi:hypothetical protein